VTDFVRFEATAPNSRGMRSGVFALANRLASTGLFTPADAAWHRAANTRADLLYRNPSFETPGCYDRTVNPGARAWFRSSAAELLTMTRGYLELLDRYGVGWVEVRTDDPGRITHSDDVQVVAVPRP
jgi:hypothetical protein